ncbi:MAG: ChaN family lipoprotein [Thermodesulfobacteriota bacterium]
MTTTFNLICTTLLFLAASLTLFTISPQSCPAANQSTYELAISFDLEKRLLNGTAKLTLAENQGVTLSLDGLEITGIVLNQHDRGALQLSLPDQPLLVIPASSRPQELLISYTLRPDPYSGSNRINDDGIVLTSGWHPVPDRKMTFRLSTSLPGGFLGIAENDKGPPGVPQDEPPVFSFSQPVHTIHFAAGPYVYRELAIDERLKVWAMFFAEDQSLIDSYLEKAAGYIKRYEEMIGPFPYNHYGIVANRLPTGYGMPTYTLLGQQVLRLPFIVDTSLGHEVLHSWFGNSIDISPDSGNWCEGLTSYLADHAFAEEKGKGLKYRKAAIVNYLNYAKDKPFTLEEFRGGGHQGRTARAVRAVGYNRAALFFHELRGMIGPELFIESLRLFYERYRFSAAGWKELQKSFEETTSRELESFFSERLRSAEIPSFQINNFNSRNKEDKVIASFTVEQQSETLFGFKLNFIVQTGSGKKRFSQFISEKNHLVELTLDDQPQQLIVDPEYDLLRDLGDDEYPAVWSQFSGSDNQLIILESEEVRSHFAPFIQQIEKRGGTVQLDKDVTNQQLRDKDLLFLGTGGTSCRSLFSRVNHPEQGFTLDTRKHPLQRNGVSVLVSSSDIDQCRAALRKLSHYGKYSLLHFMNGRNRTKNTAETENGLQFLFESPIQSIATDSINSFSENISKLSNNRVIYVGEQHDAYADHILQYRIIQALHERNPKLAIGMEMFPASSNDALSNYINSPNHTSEYDFLKNSRYFDVWNYDFRFFRDIFNFARRHKIPVIGLNLERKTVSKVYREGHTDNLSKEELNLLPEDRNLDLSGYRKRLTEVHRMHDRQDSKGFLSGFIQAQGIWDETMAKNIVNFLEEHPESTMVVLAGSQHTRKDSGIPPRVAARMDIAQASVINLNSARGVDSIKDEVDFIFILDDVELPPTGKIGIVLVEKEVDGNKGLFIDGISPHGRAGEAGLKEGDQVLAIENISVTTMSDLRIGLMDQRPGDTINLTIGRSGEEKKIAVTLSSLQKKPPNHP